MKRDSRLSGMLHVLLHMAEHSGPATSETLAKAMDTNPVVVRRTMAGLRAAGLVHSEKGHGGGWQLARPPAAIALRDVHDALGGPALLAIGHRNESPGCLVEQAVNAALSESLRAAEAALLERFAQVTLADLGSDVRRRMGRKRYDLESAHG